MRNGGDRISDDDRLILQPARSASASAPDNAHASASLRSGVTIYMGYLHLRGRSAGCTPRLRASRFRLYGTAAGSFPSLFRPAGPSSRLSAKKAHVARPPHCRRCELQGITSDLCSTRCPCEAPRCYRSWPVRPGLGQGRSSSTAEPLGPPFDRISGCTVSPRIASAWANTPPLRAGVG